MRGKHWLLPSPGRRLVEPICLAYRELRRLAWQTMSGRPAADISGRGGKVTASNPAIRNVTHALVVDPEATLA
jgi:hypothetical protein